jgi:BirA family biotin operon repressor/biotin-[acetyl-CoA-carboxylase] ligase
VTEPARRSPYADLSRPPLSEAALRRALVVPGGLFTGLRVVAETGSTNADVAEAARNGAREGLVIVAESQVAGRGRLDRQWVSPARAGLTLSVLLDPAVEPGRLGWLPLLGGVALAEAVGRLAQLETALKWPNDLLIKIDHDGYAKCAGILAEAVPVAGATMVVLGIGLNVSQRADELPPRDPAVPPATSLVLADALCTDRDPLLRGVLRSLAGWYERWRDAAGDPGASGLADAYSSMCMTLGRRVTVALPGGEEIEGVAASIDPDGRLVVRPPAGPERAVAAGDVRHLR